MNYQDATCYICGKASSSKGIGHHIPSCLTKHIDRGSGSEETSPAFHCRVTGIYRKEYWLHLLIPARFTLGDFDDFLRDIWVECCNHQSAFFLDRPYGNQIGKNSSINEVRNARNKIFYVYDAGASSTELEICFYKSYSTSPEKGKKITVLTRNPPNEFVCSKCREKNAAVLCLECIAEFMGGWLCKSCAPKHDCFLDETGQYNQDKAIPIANSPRVGVCHYIGASDSSMPLP